jgi:hypothetical protein
MPQDAPQSLALPLPVQGWQPTTFLERGMVLPFTTPHLAGARLRPAERGGLELIVPNFAGGRGVYIVRWDAMEAMFGPTLHDRRLNEKLLAAPVVGPGTIRRMAREVAAEGLAGREAAVAAAAALAGEEQQRLIANLELLLELVRQTEPREPGWRPPEPCEREELERRVRAAVSKLATLLNHSAEAVTTMLEQLAMLFSPIGIGRQRATARLPRAIAELAALRTEMSDWQRACGEAGSADAALIEATADLTLGGARTALERAWALLQDFPAMMQRWAAEPAAMARLVGRTEWLLDGWERICLLWRAADERIGRPATLAEMATLAPAIPREAVTTVETQMELQIEALRHRRRVMPAEDWRTGITVPDLVCRNERLRALAPDGPA